MWRVFYESAEITITSWYVEVDGARVAVHELLGMTRCLTYRYPLVKVAAVVAGLELAIAVPFAVAYGSATMVCAGLVSSCGVAIGAWQDAQRNPRYLEIHATVRGRRVVLFGTRDKRQFGQVWRALVRAAEDSREPVPWAKADAKRPARSASRNPGGLERRQPVADSVTPAASTGGQPVADRNPDDLPRGRCGRAGSP